MNIHRLALVKWLLYLYLHGEVDQASECPVAAGSASEMGDVFGKQCGNVKEKAIRFRTLVEDRSFFAKMQ